jgi:UDPglucose 6-dehydrogenase
VAVLGASFKPNSDDVRDSPALSVATDMARRGARVSVFDPVARHNAQRAAPFLRYPTTIRDAAEGAVVLLHLTEWEQFHRLDPSSLNDLVARRHILDARNTLDAERWRSEGWVYQGLGRL